MSHTNQPTLTTDASATRLAMLGDEMLIRLTGSQTGERIALFEERSPPGGGVPMHVHEREDETFQVLAGTVEFTIREGTEARVLVARTGDSVWAPRGVAHAWRVLGDEPVRLLFAATPAGIEGMFEELATLPKGPPDFTKIAEVCGRFGVRFA
jgi:quercetin dioxygenase-like cupin family protein